MGLNKSAMRMKNNGQNKENISMKIEFHLPLHIDVPSQFFIGGHNDAEIPYGPL